MNTATGKWGGPPPPPLSEWLFRTMRRMHRKGLLELASANLRISVPTLRNGGPKGAKAQARLMCRIMDGVERRVARDKNDDIARGFRDRTRPRVENGLTNNFWFAFGNHEDPVVRDVAAGIDNLDTALFHQRKSLDEVDEALCRLAADPEAVPRPAILSPAPHRLPLNAMLLMLAALDHAHRSGLRPEVWPSAIALAMAPRSIDGTFRSPTRRFLDFLYPTALHFDCRRRKRRFSMPAGPATIEALDDAFHLHPPDGKRSPVVYWRSGEKKLYSGELDTLLRTVFGEAADEAIALFGPPYLFALFWEGLRSDAPEDVDWAIQRYTEWWTLLSKRDPTQDPPQEKYWARI